jgi:FkbM family methyltransferase
MAKILAEKILCRAPFLYRTLLSLHKPFNHEKAVYLRLVKRGDVVIEVGANIGYFTRLFANIVGEKGHVIALEPIPQTRITLLQNVQDLKWITVLPYAVSNEEGKCEMFIPGEIHGQASLKQHSDSAWGNEPVSHVTVDCLPLARLEQMHSFGRVNFIKVDVEGAEIQVLKGAREILLRDHPILHLEIEDRWMKSFGYGAADIEFFLRSVGYTFFAAYDKDFIVLDSLKSFKGGNVVCSSRRI